MSNRLPFENRRALFPLRRRERRREPQIVLEPTPAQENQMVHNALEGNSPTGVAELYIGKNTRRARRARIPAEQSSNGSSDDIIVFGPMRRKSRSRSRGGKKHRASRRKV